MSANLIRIGRAVDLVTVFAENPSFQLGLESVEPHTGRLIDGELPEYSGHGVAFEPGDVLFGKLRPYLAKSWQADRSGAAVGEFHVYRPNPDLLDSTFFKYFTLSRNFLDQVVSSVYGAKMPRVSWDFVRNIEVYSPPLQEQRAIADYLDRETQKIDELITEQRSLIETLRERARALTERAVTRGVSEANTEVSIIPWLYGGQVASDWTTSRIKYVVASLRAGTMIPADSINAEGEYPVYGGNGIRGYTNDYTHDGDHILIGRQGALCGNVHLCRGRFWASEHAIVVEPDRDVSPTWLEHLLRIMDLGQYSMASAQPGIGVGQISPLQIPLPPSSEQKEIAAYLDDQTSRIDELISESEDLITLSQERRAALITAAVTGQIDVRRPS